MSWTHDRKCNILAKKKKLIVLFFVIDKIREAILQFEALSP